MCKAEADELRWDRIEALRKAIVLVVQGETWFDLETCEGANALAEAIERCTTKVADEVGTGCALVPSGARVIVGQEPQKSVVKERAEVAKLVRNSSHDAVRVYMRPLGESAAARRYGCFPHGRRVGSRYRD